MNGRTCSQPEQGFFAGLLDYRIYEAEYGGISDKAQLLIREPYRDRDPSWTGSNPIACTIQSESFASI